MTNDEWAKFKNFKRDSPIDVWGDPSRMQLNIISNLQLLRDYIGRPIFVTSGFRLKSKTTHGKGLAVDVIIDIGNSKPIDILIDVLRHKFGGVGVYPYWSHHLVKSPLGFHLDTRDSEYKALWMGVPDRDENNNIIKNEESNGIKQRYLDLSLSTLREHGVIN